MNVYEYPSAAAEERLTRIARREFSFDADKEAEVREIIAQVAQRGDAALVDYTRRYDAPGFKAEQIQVSAAELETAVPAVDPAFLRAVAQARENIERFHQAQVRRSWFSTSTDGVVVGQMVTPLASAGLYIPGGRGGETPLISSLLMNAVPALVAGVERLQVVTPPRADGSVNPYLLAAAKTLGIRRLYKAGSAWGVAALALGTETIEPVDKVVGPGNIYVSLAKKLLAGKVGIDILAGPSEILVIADSGAEADEVAADLLSQAEHDAMASAILVTPERKLAEAVVESLQQQLARLPRREIAAAALAAFGGCFVVADMETALGLANRIAPEHLELLVADPWRWLGRVRHAGAVFLGRFSPEPVGDYFAGPNHVLPTGGTARFSSALGVEHFQKSTNVVMYSREALQRDADSIVLLAELEGLQGHANALRVRMQAPAPASGRDA